MLVKSGDVATLAEWLQRDEVTGRSTFALEFADEKISYAEVAVRSRRVANGLIAAGVGHGDRVAVMDKNSHRQLEILFGCTLIGAVPVSVNWRLAPPEVSYIINDARALVLFCGEAFVQLIESIQDELDTVQTCIATDFAHAQWADYDQWRDTQSDALPDVKISPDDTVFQLYTSGTTGHPKGAELTHHNLMEALEAVKRRGDRGWYDWDEADVNLVCMPMFHIAGVLWPILGMFTGTRNLLMPDVDPGAILKIIQSEKVTRVLFVPAVILFLLQHPDAGQTDFSSLKQIVYGASPIPEELLKQALQVFGCEMAQVYGLTETTGSTSSMSAEDHQRGGERLRSCGRPNDGVQVEVWDEKGKVLRPGEIGEIVVRGRGVMKGYWNAPEKTAKSLRDGWFHTGDAGYFDDEGFLYIHDRLTDMIVSGGENIYPAEVESALFSHPDIADVAIIGIPDEKWGEVVHAVVVAAPERTAPDLTQLQTFARELLAGYKIPNSMELIEMLPRNPSGKILRRQLREKYWQGRERAVN